MQLKLHIDMFSANLDLQGLAMTRQGSTPLCSTRREALKSLDFRAFLFSPGCGVNGALAHLSGSAFSIVAGLIAAILYK